MSIASIAVLVALGLGMIVFLIWLVVTMSGRAAAAESELETTQEDLDEADQLIAVLAKAAPEPSIMARDAGRTLRRRLRESAS